MKVEHINITAFEDETGFETGTIGAIVPRTLLSAASYNKINVIKTLLISTTSATDATVSLGFQYGLLTPYSATSYEDEPSYTDEEEEEDPRPEDSNTDYRKLGVRSDADIVRTDSRFYILKETAVPVGSALDVIDGFPNGIPYSSAYSLFITLGAATQSVSIIIAYE